MRLTLALLNHEYVILKLPPTAAVSEQRWINWDQPFVSVTRTADELCVVTLVAFAPSELLGDGGAQLWRAFKLVGQFDFSVTGVLRALVTPLSDAGLPVLSFSTFDTDFVLVHSDDVATATRALGENFHVVPENELSESHPQLPYYSAAAATAAAAARASVASPPDAAAPQPRRSAQASSSSSSEPRSPASGSSSASGAASPRAGGGSDADVDADAAAALREPSASASARASAAVRSRVGGEVGADVRHRAQRTRSPPPPPALSSAASAAATFDIEDPLQDDEISGSGKYLSESDEEPLNERDLEEFDRRHRSAPVVMASSLPVDVPLPFAVSSAQRSVVAALPPAAAAARATAAAPADDDLSAFVLSESVPQKILAQKHASFVTHSLFRTVQ